MAPVYFDCIEDHEGVPELLEEMRNKLAKEFGVTLIGNRCTLRWLMDDQFVNVHMIIAEATTAEESLEHSERTARMQELIKKYPDLQEELYFVEHGEHSK